ncbi:gamma-glutamyltransferase [Falsiroseomonas selenitidurans]|uniref:Glutathione hydrolase proenzyme n=1 Tax=Falsiroseomonas selenitidurans TaxID=2716335 RepID=A0ABX1DXK8_9PROT|nr:gamma-glutamyltransferase [Falsiroseomonas selenitidurans]NKC29644.1 gamma-glutamyltransferase [Falsiroseomonas selenitidurans]
MASVGRNGFALNCEKAPATGARGVVTSNHPMASAAGAQVLLEGGNAVDAAIATLFALTVVEPMMVGLLGGGVGHVRMADGRHAVMDGLSTAPAAATPDMYRPRANIPPEEREVEGRLNAIGALSVAVPASLRAWAETLSRFGSWSLADVMAPAIRLAGEGFRATPYLSDCIGDAAADLARDADLAARFLPGGAKLAPGARFVQGAYAETLRAIAKEGPDLLHQGALGGLVADALATAGGIVTRADLAGSRPIERAPIHGTYRGFDVFAPPPPASAGVHMAQMLHVMEGFDVASMGFGTADSWHLVAEVLKMAFADRSAATADPDFVQVPVALLTSRRYAALRRAEIDLARAKAWAAHPSLQTPLGESNCTTHVTVADAAGNIVATTQTINALFGARIAIPGTGLIANNYMHNFDPRPGHALSVQPGKRVYTSMAPTIVLQDGRPAFALGLPGGLKIFPSAFQAVLNLIDHGMTLQQAVEAPRIWTQGLALELEPGVPEDVAAALAARGQAVRRVATIGGGMNGIAFNEDGTMTGAACWRADGSVVALGGGLARAGVRFVLETPKPA